MKHLIPFIFAILLLSVNSCADAVSIIPNDMGTAVASTQTAVMWTAIPTLTPNPYIPFIITWLNNDLSTANPLGSTLDAEYHVTDVSFSKHPGRSTLIFRVDVNCDCKNGVECCIPERTFVVIIEAMKRNRDLTLTQLPGWIDEILVVCSNEKTKSQIGAMSASWQDVQGYLQNQVSGYQLGVRVTHTIAP